MREIKFELMWKHEDIFSTINVSIDDIIYGSYATPKTTGGQKFELVAKRQFIGRSDNDGNDVYEGDIFWNGNEDYQPMIISFDDNTSSFVMKSKCGKDIDDIDSMNFSNYRLFGNIHQHPHLLEHSND